MIEVFPALAAPAFGHEMRVSRRLPRIKELAPRLEVGNRVVDEMLRARGVAMLSMFLQNPDGTWRCLSRVQAFVSVRGLDWGVCSKNRPPSTGKRLCVGGGGLLETVVRTVSCTVFALQPATRHMRPGRMAQNGQNCIRGCFEFPCHACLARAPFCHRGTGVSRVENQEERDSISTAARVEALIARLRS